MYFIRAAPPATDRAGIFTTPNGSNFMRLHCFLRRTGSSAAVSMPNTELHGLITKHLGVPETHIVCEYGMSELSSQAYDRAIAECEMRSAECAVGQRQTLFRFPPWARVQIISPETGQPLNEGEA